ncbi:hypothetical protein KKG31_04120 [Patescibacteria group bacterium]|nr:hypothetical protein [Patescibacteria group bacterium]MBU1758329.1 hypothetical protein [Patescibacteria group bacterium]
MANDLLKKIIATPDMMEKLTAGKMSENIFYNQFIEVTLEQLPELYQNNIKILNTIEQ